MNVRAGALQTAKKIQPCLETLNAFIVQLGRRDMFRFKNLFICLRTDIYIKSPPQTGVYCNTFIIYASSK